MKEIKKDGFDTPDKDKMDFFNSDIDDFFVDSTDYFSNASFVKDNRYEDYLDITRYDNRLPKNLSDERPAGIHDTAYYYHNSKPLYKLDEKNYDKYRDIIDNKGQKRKKLSALKLTLIIIVFILLAISIITYGGINLSLYGYQFLPVNETHYAPQYSWGDLIIVRKTFSDTVNSGDIITYIDNDNLYATGKVMSINDDEGTGLDCYSVSNDSGELRSVNYDRVVGRVERILSGYGNAVIFLNKRLMLIMIVLTVILIALFISKPIYYYIISLKRNNAKI